MGQLNRSNNIEFYEIFQAVPSVTKNAKLDDYNLQDYALNKDEIYVSENEQGVYPRSYKINQDYALTIKKFDKDNQKTIENAVLSLSSGIQSTEN